MRCIGFRSRTARNSVLDVLQRVASAIIAMTMVAIRGHFDGKVFVPDEPVDFPRNRPLVLHVEVPVETSTPPAQQGLWQMMKQNVGAVDAPEDWAVEHDHYLYGTPKRQNKAG